MHIKVNTTVNLVMNDLKIFERPDSSYIFSGVSHFFFICMMTTYLVFRQWSAVSTYFRYIL